MIIITAQTADTAGVVEIEESPDSTFGEWQARVSRSKTLDGGVWINHSGVVDGDRTFTIKADITEAQKTALRHLYRNYQTVNLSCCEGFFEGSIYSLDTGNGVLTLKFYVKGGL